MDKYPIITKEHTLIFYEDLAITINKACKYVVKMLNELGLKIVNSNVVVELPNGEIKELLKL
jgi:hypothetical protein